jgi:hypothetical protein
MMCEAATFSGDLDEAVCCDSIRDRPGQRYKCTSDVSVESDARLNVTGPIIILRVVRFSVECSSLG